MRLPYSVIEQKQGTCIDLAVTYASCLEAAGLFPLIMIKKGHAYCGCRLEEETFADCVIDDFSAIDKRTVSGNEDILLVECTDFTAGEKIDFDRAVKHGKIICQIRKILYVLLMLEEQEREDCDRFRKK